MTQKKNFSRRAFIGTSALGIAGLTLIPGCVTRHKGPVRLGFIGLGRQTMFLVNSFMNLDGVEVLAGADVYGIKRKRFEQRVNAFYREKEKNISATLYEDYRQLLSRDDIDAVVIASPDHWHARMALDACEAGKDIYLEKPLTYTIKEGKMLVDAVRNHNRILAVGSQQRSDPSFQHAVRMVQEGRLGTLTNVNVFIGQNPHPVPYNKPEQEVPADLNWEKWIGPAPILHYNEVLNPPISLDPPQDEKYWGAWRRFKELGGGLMTDWGAHMMDIAQWGLERDRSGPVKVIPAGSEGKEFDTFVYDTGLEITLEAFDEHTRGVKFWGTDGWIEVSRGKYVASDDALKPEVEESEVPYEGRSAHHRNFIESVKSRKDPVVPVEIGHRTCTACTLGNIAYELQRPVEWDPESESFVNDPGAEAFMHRPYKHGYSL